MKRTIRLLRSGLQDTASVFSYYKSFSESELQAKVEAAMPLEGRKLLARATVSEPRLQLYESSNKLSIEARIEASIMGKIQGSGTCKIEGSISYNRDSGTFHFDNPVIVELNIDKVPHTYHSMIRRIAQITIANKFKQVPVFTFRDDTLRHKLARAAVRSAAIENKKLKVKLSVR